MLKFEYESQDKHAAVSFNTKTNASSFTKRDFSYLFLTLSLPSVSTPALQPHRGHAEMVSQRSKPTQLKSHSLGS